VFSVYIFQKRGMILSQEKTSVWANGLIWFGAAVSIAEILTGTLIAPLGFTTGLTAILLGHLIGCVLFYFVGLIGADTECSAMETVKRSFGQKGSLLFSGLNILQLVGWTAVMIVSGAAAANSIVPLGNGWIWSLAICGLILLWILVGVQNLTKINTVAMLALFVLSVILSVITFRGNVQPPQGELISFGTAVELSATMPLSWLPLISDYTRFAKRKKAATFASAAVYFVTSSWMFLIGLGAALYTGESDISAIMKKAGLGIAGLIIVIFATVTTTFLDAYSAGVSAVSVSKKVNEKWAAVAVCIGGTILALFTPITQYESFLYLIGSVFAPMAAIQIVDFFILKQDHSHKQVPLTNLILWVFGFVLYRIFLTLDTPLGNTLPVMLLTGLLSIIIHQWYGGNKKC
jgi:putative hydroxymethylpyrimidine transporter CytX